MWLKLKVCYMYRTLITAARKVLGWPKRCKLARAFPLEYIHKGLQVAQLLGQRGVALTCEAACIGVNFGDSRPFAPGFWPAAYGSVSSSRVRRGCRHGCLKGLCNADRTEGCPLKGPPGRGGDAHGGTFGSVKRIARSIREQQAGIFIAEESCRTANEIVNFFRVLGF